MGNIFAVRPGLDKLEAPTFAGSHLGPPPIGGRFDGVQGRGLKCCACLRRNWIETEGPVGVANWTNEERAWFPLSMMVNGVWSDGIPPKRAYETLKVGDSKGGRNRVKEELKRIGYLGQTKANWSSGIQMRGRFELHIEQGPHLVSAGEKIGVVEGAQAYRWMTISFEGRGCHSGTTSFEHRTDGPFCAAQMMVEAKKIAEGHRGLATVDIIEVDPGSVNTVPGRVTMSMDMRHYSDDSLKLMVDELQKMANSLVERLPKSRRDLKIQLAVRFQEEAVDCVEAATRSLLENNSDPKPLM